MNNFKDASRENYGIKNQDGVSRNPTLEELKTGSLQRIADAVEKMASNYVALENERDLYKRWYKEQREQIATLKKSKAALTGVINKLKKKQTQQQQQL